MSRSATRAGRGFLRFPELPRRLRIANQFRAVFQRFAAGQLGLIQQINSSDQMPRTEPIHSLRQQKILDELPLERNRRRKGLTRHKNLHASRENARLSRIGNMKKPFPVPVQAKKYSCTKCPGFCCSS